MTKVLQATARAVLSDALTEAEREECGKELDDYQTAANSDYKVLVVLEIVQQRIVASLWRNQIN